MVQLLLFASLIGDASGAGATHIRFDSTFSVCTASHLLLDATVHGGNTYAWLRFPHLPDNARRSSEMVTHYLLPTENG
jgi:hypothetical protein